ncbi:MAG TPA: ATP12 family protein [Bauldia sp.]|nr:ATP12 family protein [Bauldia sp.]
MSDTNDPVETSQRLSRPELPKRFYKSATAGAHDLGFTLLLDGRAVKTPARRALTVPRREVAEALAAEWDGQGERIDPATMPLTRIVNAAIDRVTEEMTAVRAEIVKYAATDLICYRAESPDALAAMQAAVWDPLVKWARESLGAQFRLAAGVVHVAQPPEALSAIARALDEYDPLTLAAISTVTTLTGSAVVALALAHGRISAEEAWTAALVDEEWEMSQWGRDEVAMAARAFRWREMGAAALILAPP